MNWQNIPADLKVVRRAVVPKQPHQYLVGPTKGEPAFYNGERGVISSFDYGKIEPRLLAYFASKKGDDTLANYLRSGVDPYRAVIGPVYGKKPDELTDREYKDGKILFLSLVYGAGKRSVMAAFGVTNAEAGARIKQFHAAWPIVRQLQDDVVKVCNRRGYIRTPWGRPLRLEQYGEHKMLNKLVQGSAAHMLKRSLIRVDAWLETQPDLASHMILNVHDEIDFDGPADEVAYLNEHVPALMGEELIEPVVPILVDHEVSVANWAEKLDFHEWERGAVAAS